MTVNSMFPTCFNPGNLLQSFQTNFYRIISWKPAIFHSVKVFAIRVETFARDNMSGMNQCFNRDVGLELSGADFHALDSG